MILRKPGWSTGALVSGGVLDPQKEQVKLRAVGRVAVRPRVLVAEPGVEVLAALIRGQGEQRGPLRGLGLEQCGVQPGSDAVGLPWWANGQFAQPYQPPGAGAFGDLVGQRAEPVRGVAGERVAEADGTAADIGDD
ncbi:hypothetical protein GCM10010304_77080 [Streptomyces roseoviolaceus]